MMQQDGRAGRASPNSANAEVDENCTAVPRCITRSKNHRKIVSHIFGRNKSQTRQIPDECFPMYCRKHYQRLKFRCGNNGTWIFMQIDLVRKQLDRMEKWGGVTSWNIMLSKLHQIEVQDAALARKSRRDEKMQIRRRARSSIDSHTSDENPSTVSHDDNASRGNKEGTFIAENNSDSRYNNQNNGTDHETGTGQVLNLDRERILLPYTGNRKSFEEVRFVLEIIASQAKNSPSDDKIARSFPALEFLPNIDTGRFPPRSAIKNSPSAQPSTPISFKATSDSQPTPSSTARILQKTPPGYPLLPSLPSLASFEELIDQQRASRSSSFPLGASKYALDLDSSEIFRFESSEFLHRSSGHLSLSNCNSPRDGISPGTFNDFSQDVDVRMGNTNDEITA